jgi:hypothetical protein
MDKLTAEQAEIKAWLEDYGWEEIEFSGDLVRSPQITGPAVWRLAALLAFKAGNYTAIVDDDKANGRPEWPE